jgi:hypothetical protein
MATRKRFVDVAPRRAAPTVSAIKVLVLPDEDPDTSWMDDPEHADRREAYERGDFAFVGVRAEAEVVIEGVGQTLTSGGLWGIESDTSDEYLREVAEEEYRDLRQILLSIGVPSAQVPAKMDPSWVEWRA